MNSRISPSHRCLGGFTAAAAAAIAISAGCAPGSSAFNAPTISRPASTYDSKLRPRGIAYKYFQLTGLGIGSARDIALGHDGNLWISTDSQCTIERLTPTGVATAYSYGNVSGCSQSTSITPGPDGKLWFIDRTANIVGKISTKGAIKTYPLPAASPCN
ncbi:MAG: hypothetical protein JO311_06840, partial [Candidatus Eremiobacteraeota bacterium]|nr:hypothetical protein [Candidatus Eremiobacteraeota bacterium]MBV9264213.1 hypothetical protein [Candidatus Eremiobacteraeota bacterium]